MGPIFIKILLSDLTMFGAKNRAEITNFMKLLNLLHLRPKVDIFGRFSAPKITENKKSSPNMARFAAPICIKSLNRIYIPIFPRTGKPIINK